MAYKDKEKQKTYQREWKNRRRKEWLEQNGPCISCGSTQNLEVDHVDRESKVDHKVWSWSKERRDKELAKCQVLCEKCHKKKTGRERRSEVKHGTIHMYKKYKCRCADCKKAKSIENKKRKRVVG